MLLSSLRLVLLRVCVLVLLRHTFLRVRYSRHVRTCSLGSRGIQVVVLPFWIVRSYHRVVQIQRVGR